ncbi:glycosyltransferase family 2 protein [soil metagenome]
MTTTPENPSPAEVARPDLSIVIVNWNGCEMLRNLLRSIEANHDGLCVQTIVSDNASTDGSANTVAAEFGGVTLFRNATNLGFARGNNVGVKSATGRHILFLNNDMVVRPGAFAALVAFLDSHPEVAAVGPKLIGGDGKPQRAGRALLTFAALLNRITLLKATGLFRKAYKEYRRGGFDPERPGVVGQLDGAALLVRRDQFNQLGGWDEGFEFGGEDVDLCKRLGDLGAVYYLPEAEIEHLGRISSRANRPYTYRTYECGYVRYLAKHHGRGKALLYKLLVTLDMPLRVLAAAVQTAYHGVRGQKKKADRSRDVLVASSAFLLKGMPSYWRS